MSLSVITAVFIFYTLLPDNLLSSSSYSARGKVQYTFKRQGVVAGDPPKLRR